MSYQDFASAGGSGDHSVSLYASGGRIYAQNRQSFLIDIGACEQSADGFSYRIAGAPQLAGSGFAGADDVLGELAGKLDAELLDTGFRSLPDRSEDYSLDLRHAAHRTLLLRNPPLELDDEAAYALPPSLTGHARYTSLPGR